MAVLPLRLGGRVGQAVVAGLLAAVGVLVDGAVAAVLERAGRGARRVLRLPSSQSSPGSLRCRCRTSRTAGRGSSRRRLRCCRRRTARRGGVHHAVAAGLVALAVGGAAVAVIDVAVVATSRRVDGAVAADVWEQCSCEQPSPSTWLPSSHCSPGSRLAVAQPSVRHCAEQPSPLTVPKLASQPISLSFSGMILLRSSRSLPNSPRKVISYLH